MFLKWCATKSCGFWVVILDILNWCTKSTYWIVLVCWVRFWMTVCYWTSTTLKMLDLKSMLLPGGWYLPNLCYYLYYLVDGIYPKWAILTDYTSEGIYKIDQHFASAQEALWKDVERAIGELIWSRHILKHQSLFGNRATVKKVMCGEIILHDMIVESRGNGCKSELFMETERVVERSLFLDENGNMKPLLWRTRARGIVELGHVISDSAQVRMLNERDSLIRDEIEHYGLKYDMVRHVWNNWKLRSQL